MSRGTALSKSSSLACMPVGVDEDENEDEDDDEDDVLAAAVAKTAPAMNTLRTAEGDLIRNELSGFQSFTAGAHSRPKPMVPLLKPMVRCCFVNTIPYNCYKCSDEVVMICECIVSAPVGAHAHGAAGQAHGALLLCGFGTNVINSDVER